MVQRADDGAAEVSAAYDVTLRPGDPLIPLIRIGDVGGQQLAARVVGGPWVDSRVIVQTSGPGSETHVSWRYVVRAGPPFAVGFDDVPSSLGAPATVHRTVRLEVRGCTILAVRGGEVQDQDATHVTVTGAEAIEIRLDSDTSATAVEAGADSGGTSGWLYVVVESLRQGWFAWSLALLLPWLAVAAIRRGPTRRLANVATIFVLACIVVGSVMIWADVEVVGRVGFALFCVAMPLLLLAVPWAAGIVRPRARDLTVAAAAAAGVALIPAGLYGHTLPALAGWALVFGPPAAGFATALLLRRAALAGAAAAFAGVAVALGLSRYLFVGRPAEGEVAAMAIGLVWALLFGVPLVLRRSLWWLAAVLPVGALLLVRPVRLALEPVSTFRGGPDAGFTWQSLGTQSRTLAGLVLIGTLAGLLARAGREPGALRERGMAPAAVALALGVAIDPAPFSWAHVAAIGALWGGLVVLLPKGDPRARLVSPGTHGRLVRAELRRRMLRIAAADVYRGGRARLAGEPEAIEAYDGAQQRLDEAVARGGQPIDGVAVGDAFTTDAGRAPTLNAFAAVGYAAPAAALLIIYEVVALLQQDDRSAADLTLLGLADTARHLLRWPVFAALFGYCYPLLRGNGPLPKALNLAAVVLVAELLPVLADPHVTASGRQLVIALLLRAGQVLVFFVVLGLLWERRLAVLADVGWNRLRDLRRATTLAAPAGTVVLTVVTALGTALAGAAAAALIANQAPAPPSPPRPSPSVSAGR